VIVDIDRAIGRGIMFDSTPDIGINPGADSIKESVAGFFVYGKGETPC
jgi:hypothetical protein